MPTKCQGKVPSTLYNTIMQWRSYYPHRNSLREAKYFAQGTKLLSSTVRSHLHVWLSEVTTHVANVLLHSGRLLSPEFHWEGTRRVPACTRSLHFLTSGAACLRQTQTLKMTSLELNWCFQALINASRASWHYIPVSQPASGRGFVMDFWSPNNEYMLLTIL